MDLKIEIDQVNALVDKLAAIKNPTALQGAALLRARICLRACQQAQAEIAASSAAVTAAADAVAATAQKA
ncbi:MAG: hypothetical protein KGL39_50970 [Patescibacteria group bacterium]|nr:hypothetical protein [Patescibacteria group bacterium]